MDLIEAIRTRRSIRGFKSTPVPHEILTSILDIARLSPSAVNQQPWEFIGLTGHSLEKAKQVNIEQASVGATVNPDCVATPPNQLTPPHSDRQIALARQLFSLMNIERENREQRAEWQRRGKRFFDAP
ncbi:MAG: nitroreductase, partial [Chloroflexi bacterium]|nr:nitroreductase [Chloroflexota bacterium]